METLEGSMTSAIEELARSFSRIADSIDRLTKAHAAASKLQAKSMDRMLVLQKEQTDRDP